MNRNIHFKAVFKEDYMPPDVMNQDKMIYKGIYEITGLHFFEGIKLTSISIASENYGEIQDVWLEDAPIEVIEYTGLNDINNVPIFEGDIMDYGYNRFLTVIFKNGKFCVDLNSMIHLPSYLIIGNRYENPKLLQESE